MGVTIHWKLQQTKLAVPSTLDRAEAMAKMLRDGQAKALGIPFEIERLGPMSLMINLGGCESVSFNFFTVRELEGAKNQAVNGEGGWNETAWMYQCLTRDGAELPDEGYRIADYPQNEKAYARAFCKTQYAGNIIEHQFVAEIIRSVAAYCEEAEVHDEGDYYHTGQLGDAVKAIGSLGEMINGLGMMLASNFGAENVLKGGETKVGRKRTAKKA